MGDGKESRGLTGLEWSMLPFPPASLATPSVSVSRSDPYLIPQGLRLRLRVQLKIWCQDELLKAWSMGVGGCVGSIQHFQVWLGCEGPPLLFFAPSFSLSPSECEMPRFIGKSKQMLNSRSTFWLLGSGDVSAGGA